MRRSILILALACLSLAQLGEITINPKTRMLEDEHG